MVKKTFKVVLLILFLVSSVEAKTVAPKAAVVVPAKDTALHLRVGFFLGGRTATFFRFWHAQRKDNKEYKISLITKDIRENTYYEITDFSKDDVNSTWSKASGDELIQLVLKGQADAAMVGETSFIKMAHDKTPLVAIAETGHDVTGEAGHAMIFRGDIDLSDPKKWKGMTFGARRSSGGDLIVLKEFLLSVGLDPNKDVKLIDQIDDDQIGTYMGKKIIDAGYFHLAKARKMMRKHPGKYKIYKMLDWVKPETSSTLLVVTKPYLEKNRKVLEKIMSDYSASIIKEKKIPTARRLKKDVKGIQLEEDFHGMNFPQSYDCPYVRTDLLQGWQKTLLEHKVIKVASNLNEFIDNTLFKCMKPLKPVEKTKTKTK